MVQIWPEARHKIDSLDIVDKYANMLGTPASVVRPTNEVDEILQGEQEQAQQQEQMAMAQAGAQTGKTLSEAKVGDDSNALNELMEAI